MSRNLVTVVYRVLGVRSQFLFFRLDGLLPEWLQVRVTEPQSAAG
jgi:hypothetical protein